MAMSQNCIVLRNKPTSKVVPKDWNKPRIKGTHEVKKQPQQNIRNAQVLVVMPKDWNKPKKGIIGEQIVLKQGQRNRQK